LNWVELFLRKDPLNATTKAARVVTVASLAVLLLFGSWAMAGARQGGGMTGNGTMGDGTMGDGTMGGISWMWIPTVLVLGLCVLLVWVIVGQKKGPP
jgi:hypothetical protein